MNTPYTILGKVRLRVQILPSNTIKPINNVMNICRKIPSIVNVLYLEKFGYELQILPSNTTKPINNVMNIYGKFRVL